MKKHIAVFLIGFFLPLSFASGQNQKLLPLSSEIYSEMDALYLLRGLGTPSPSRPWTASEALIILERAGRQTLTPKEQALYDFLSAEINKPIRFFPDKLFSLETRLDLALEAYAHTNSDDFVLAEDWIYGYEERQPLAKLSLEMNISSWFYTFTSFQFGRSRFDKRDSFRNVDDIDQGIGAVSSFSDSFAFPWKSWAYSRSFLSNIPTGLDEFDFDWPKRADISFGGRHWNLTIARERIQWGRGYSGNFVIDSHRDYDEYIRLSAFTDKFKYEWLNVFYPSPEKGILFKFFMAHRLEFRIVPSLVFALSEGIMCRPDAFSARYINPAFVFHNWYDRDHLNSLAYLELDFAPFKGYRFYTQAVIDQIHAVWESNGEPGAWGILAGIEHARPAPGGILSFSLEWAYTSPLLYRRDMVDFITLSDTQVTGASQSLAFDYTGYQYGGDAIVLQLDVNYRFPGAALIHARFFGMIHGKMNYFTLHNEGGNENKPSLTDGTPSGDKDEREYTLGFSLGGNYTIPQPVSWLKIRVWTELDLIIKKNKLMLSESGKNLGIFYNKKGGTVDFQFSTGIAFSI